MKIAFLYLSCSQTITKEPVAEPASDVLEPSDTPDSPQPDTSIQPVDSGEQSDTSSPEDSAVPEDPAERAGWELVWRDEFNGSSIDTSLWSFEVNAAGGGNNESHRNDPDFCLSVQCR